MPSSKPSQEDVRFNSKTSLVTEYGARFQCRTRFEMLKKKPTMIIGNIPRTEIHERFKILIVKFNSKTSVREQNFNRALDSKSPIVFNG